jgi:hypothetical protein
MAGKTKNWAAIALVFIILAFSACRAGDCGCPMADENVGEVDVLMC